MITSGKTVTRMFSVIDAEPDSMLQKCAKFQHNQPQLIPFVYIVGSVNHTSGKCCNKPNDNREEPRSTPRDLRDPRPKINHGRMGQPQGSHHQTRFNEGLNRQYSPSYASPYQSTLGSIPGQDLSATLM